MTLCEHDMKFKNNFGDCPTCIRFAENKRVLDKAEKLLCRKNRCDDGYIKLTRKELASLRLKGDESK